MHSDIRCCFFLSIRLFTKYILDLTWLLYSKWVFFLLLSSSTFLFTIHDIGDVGLPHSVRFTWKHTLFRSLPLSLSIYLAPLLHYSMHSFSLMIWIDCIASWSIPSIFWYAQKKSKNSEKGLLHVQSFHFIDGTTFWNFFIVMMVSDQLAFSNLFYSKLQCIMQIWNVRWHFECWSAVVVRLTWSALFEIRSCRFFDKNLFMGFCSDFVCACVEKNENVENE